MIPTGGNRQFLVDKADFGVSGGQSEVTDSEQFGATADRNTLHHAQCDQLQVLQSIEVQLHQFAHLVAALLVEDLLDHLKITARTETATGAIDDQRLAVGPTLQIVECISQLYHHRTGKTVFSCWVVDNHDSNTRLFIFGQIDCATFEGGQLLAYSLDV